MMIYFLEVKTNNFFFLSGLGKKPKYLKTSSGRNICLSKTGDIGKICDELCV
jgi:hypothetical protein